MKVKDLIMLCAEMGCLDVDEGAVSDDATAGGTCTRQLLNCCNSTLEELYRDYASSIRKTVVEAVEGFIDTSQLNLCKVISLVDGEGYDVKYRYSEGGLRVKEDGRFNLCYARLPGSVGLDDDIPLPSPRITERILAYGILREYFSINGDAYAASQWEERYRGALRIADVKSSAMTLPTRRWL